MNAIVFIDGNNFYHNIKLVKGIKPGHVDFYKISELVCSHFNCEHIASRYYNSIPSIKDGEQMYYDHMKFLSSVENLPKFTIHTRKLQKHSTKEILSEKREIISNLGLCEKCTPLVEANCSECIGNVKKREKGIDVMIATDMLNMLVIQNDCDCGILISGDADFIPACEIIKKKSKLVYSAFLTKGYSYELRDKLDFFILTREILVDNCLKESLSIT